LPLLVLGIGCAAIGRLLQSAAAEVAVATGPVAATPADPRRVAPDETRDHLRVEPLELELGIGLLRLADPASGGDLLERVSQLRQRIARDLGFILPRVRVRDNLNLDPRKFQIKLRGLAVAWGEAYADALLAVDAGGVEQTLAGIASTEPATGRPARWIEPVQREAAQLAGYQVHPPQDYLIQTLNDVVRSQAAELLTRQQVHALLQELRTRAPQVVDDLVPEILKPAQIHQVLSNLLRERVPIRDLETILEALGSHAERTRNTVLLTEHVRTALARTICQSCRDEDRRLHVVALAGNVEDRLEEQLDFDDTGMQVRVSPQFTHALNSALADRLKRLSNAGRPHVVMCRPGVRPALRHLTARAHPRLHVLSQNEFTPDTELVFHSAVTVDSASANRLSSGDSPIDLIRSPTIPAPR
jgi:flagellar biosynthesis protein FlhA